MGRQQSEQLYNDYVPPKVQKAIEEAKKFVCTTTDRIVKNTKEFIQNVDWKKVAIGVAATAAIAVAVAVTGGAAAAAVPVLVGAAVGAGAGTRISIVSGAIQGKSPAEIAKDASDAFMWGAIGGAVGGGTTSVLESVGSSTAGNYVRQNLIEGGMDTAVDLAESASKGGLTPEGVLTSVVTNMAGAFIGAPDTPSTTRKQALDSVADNRTVKNAVVDSATDNRTVKETVSESVDDFIEHGTARPPKQSTPNTIYEQMSTDGSVSSRAFYDENGNQFARQDFSHSHFDKVTQQELSEHEHNYHYNSQGQRDGNKVIALPSGYDNKPNW